MRAYGSDRLRVDGARGILFSRAPKNWVARVPRTLTTAEYPGTAVMWDGEFYEVVAATPSGESVRYELEPWRDEHVIRVSEVYDEASEARLAEERQRGVARRRRRGMTHLFGMVAGYLPARAQNELASELGLSAPRLTVLSILLSMGIAVACALHVAGELVRQQPLPGRVLLLAIALTIETLVRLHVVMGQNRPIGSIPGWLLYTAFWLVMPKRAKLVSPVEAPRGERLFTLPQDDEAAAAEKVSTWSPLLTLLAAKEQQRLMETTGYDYRQHAAEVAVGILVFSSAGVVSSVLELERSGRVSAFVSLMVAAALAVEQIVRLAALRRGPAGSILGYLVRPFARRMLEPR